MVLRDQMQLVIDSLNLKDSLEKFFHWRRCFPRHIVVHAIVNC